VTGLDDEVARFLLQHIDSVELLEVLLLTRQSPGRPWSADDMARELYSHPTSIAQRFQTLLGHGLLRESAPGHFQYAPRSAELDQIVGRVAETYRERRVAVISLIASKPMENVKAFSDAFRIRKRKED
jgi:AraC-like DNA-binding protein